MNSKLESSFQIFGIYGLITYLNQNNEEKNPRVQAYNLLKAGRELAKKSANETLSYLPDIAFDLSRHESVYRMSALFYIELDNTHEALKCLSYLHYYYEEQSVEPHKQYALIKQQLVDNNKDDVDIEAFIEEYQKQYQYQKIANNIKEYSESIPTEDLSEQKMYFKRLYRRYGVDTLIFAIENDTRFNNRVKAVLLIRASRAIGAIAEEGTSIESVFANKALQLDESKAVVENSYQAYLRAGDLNKLAQLKEKHPEILL
ncbi:hypothetical protein [Psychrobacter sp. PAMC 21119]|uniref:hypothetical protein n=1 Tax=Psychrobacter sp. PAMC 21119 TaxID=1112209 RepID=UPI000288AECC|nr:hypothetical protein [Psychrobacter sp. PAMC 21119]